MKIHALYISVLLFDVIACAWYCMAVEKRYTAYLRNYANLDAEAIVRMSELEKRRAIARKIALIGKITKAQYRDRYI